MHAHKKSTVFQAPIFKKLMLAAARANILYRISPNSDKKYGKNGYKLIYAPK